MQEALAEEGHDDGQQHAQQIAGTLRAQAGGLAQPFGGAGRALVAEDGGEQVAGVAGGSAAGGLAAAQHAAHQPAQGTGQAAAGRVARAAQQAAEDVAQAAGLAAPLATAQGPQHRGDAGRALTALLGLVTQGAHHQRQGLADGRAGLFGAGAQLLGDLLHRFALQLGKQLLAETLVAHEDSCMSVGSAWSVGEGAPMIAAPVAGGRGLFRLKRVFALCFVWGLVLSLGCTLQEAGPGGGRL